jgi:rod shape determining protein RodA
MANSGFFHRAPPNVIDKLAQLSWPLLVVLCLLAAVGLAAQYSVAGGSWSPWAERHAIRFVIGLGMMIVIAVVPLEVWLRLAWPAYAVALAALALVPVMGTEALGARRWLALGPISFQPSEMMKVAIVMALASWFHGLTVRRISHPVWLMVPVAAIAVPMALVMRQPDLGTAIMLGLTGVGVMLMAGVNLLYFAAGGAAIVIGVPMAMPYLHDYQRRRIEAFLDPSTDPLGAGYHINQSMIALGSGGASGKGFLGGTQSQLDFLPEKHTDFIFTTIGEEWGFVGALAVLVLFGALVAVLMGMALTTASRFGRLLISGAALSVLGYAAINIGMVSGSLPVVGVPLPFVSYGGTSMMTLLFGLGLAMCAYVHRDEALLGPDAA